MNIGHIPLIILLFIIILFNSAFLKGIGNSICENSYNINDLRSSPYCCGSQILFTSLGFVLYLIQHNIIQMNYYILMLFIIVSLFNTASNKGIFLTGASVAKM